MIFLSTSVFQWPPYIHTFIHIYIYKHTHVYIHTYVYIHTHARIHTYIHTYTHTHTHTHTHMLLIRQKNNDNHKVFTCLKIWYLQGMYILCPYNTYVFISTGYKVYVYCLSMVCDCVYLRVCVSLSSTIRHCPFTHKLFLAQVAIQAAAFWH